MIHSAKFGSIERFIGVLVEHYAGAFPPWLAPVQVVGIPVAGEYDDYLLGVAEKLQQAGVRVEVDTSDDRMQKKIRTAQQQKVPYMLIAGGEDAAAGAVSFRYRDGTQKNGVPDRRGRRRDHRGDSVRRRAAGAERASADRSEEGVETSRRSARCRAPRTGSSGCGRRTGCSTSPVRTSRRPRRRTTARSAPSSPASDREGLIVHRGELAYAVLNLYPTRPGTC